MLQPLAVQMSVFPIAMQRHHVVNTVLQELNRVHSMSAAPSLDFVAQQKYINF